MHSNESELQSVLESDPLIQSGAVTYSITEFIPVMASQAYENVITGK